MRNYHNIEKSVFHRREYVGYGDGAWIIRLYGVGERTWIAIAPRGAKPALFARTIGELSTKLAALVEAKEAVH